MTDTEHEPIDREQFEVALELLKYMHGQTIEYGVAPEKARAFYEAILVMEDAKERAYDPDATPTDEDYWSAVETSREARADGVREATMHDARRRPDHERAIQQCEELCDWIDGERAMAHALRNRRLSDAARGVRWALEPLPPAMFLERYWLGVLSGALVGVIAGVAYV